MPRNKNKLTSQHAKNKVKSKQKARPHEQKIKHNGKTHAKKNKPKRDPSIIADLYNIVDGNLVPEKGFQLLGKDLEDLARVEATDFSADAKAIGKSIGDAASSIFMEGKHNAHFTHTKHYDSRKGVAHTGRPSTYSAPVATSTTLQSGTPEVTNLLMLDHRGNRANSGSGRTNIVRYRGRERCNINVFASDTYAVSKLSITPTNAAIFPYLSGQAYGWDRYHVGKLHFSYDTTTGTGTVGEVGIAVEPDVTDESPVSMGEAMNFSAAISGSAWNNFGLGIDGRINPLATFISEATPSVTTDLGSLLIVTDGAATGNSDAIGRLYVSYEIYFSYKHISPYGSSFNHGLHMISEVGFTTPDQLLQNMALDIRGNITPVVSGMTLTIPKSNALSGSFVAMVVVNSTSATGNQLVTVSIPVGHRADYWIKSDGSHESTTFTSPSVSAATSTCGMCHFHINQTEPNGGDIVLTFGLSGVSGVNFATISIFPTMTHVHTSPLNHPQQYAVSSKGVRFLVDASALGRENDKDDAIILDEAQVRDLQERKMHRRPDTPRNSPEDWTLMTDSYKLIKL